MFATNVKPCNIRKSLLQQTGGVGRVQEHHAEGCARKAPLAEPEGVSAKGAYDEFDLEPTVPADYDAICEALRAGDAAAVRGLLYNNLAPAAKRLQPGCAEVEVWMAEQPEALTAMVTGSGSCVFAVCQSLGDARALAERAAQKRGWWSFATLTVGEPQKVC